MTAARSLPAGSRTEVHAGGNAARRAPRPARMGPQRRSHAYLTRTVALATPLARPSLLSAHADDLAIRGRHVEPALRGGHAVRDW